MKINKQDYTHYAKFYGIPCYFNDDNGELTGRNKIYDWLLWKAFWIEYNFPSNPYGFPIEIVGVIEH